MFSRFKGMLTTMDHIKVRDDIANVQCPTLSSSPCYAVIIIMAMLQDIALWLMIPSHNREEQKEDNNCDSLGFSF